MTNLTSWISQTEALERVNWRVDDFCRAHGIGKTFFYEEVKKGNLKIIKVGSRTLVPDSEARAWQARNLEQ
ncbi:MAG: hypothetical protein OQK24_12950 [Magnetovibrio sp.]|nr:hypothetical protein [Magnetovibrio sp.]